MLKLSRAMVGHVEAICQILHGHVVGFVSRRALLQRFSVGFGELFLSIWGSDARVEATFWAQIGAKFGHLGPCWGILRASWAMGRSCSS